MTLGFAALLLIISVLLWSYTRSAANETYDLVLGGAARAIVERTLPARDGATVDLPASAMEMLAIVPDARVVYSVFVPGRGVVTGASGLPLPPGFVPEERPTFFDAIWNGAPMRFVIQGRMIDTPSGRTWVEVQIGQTVEARSAHQYLLFVSAMAGLAFVTVIGLGFVWLAIRQALHPLSRIEADILARDPRNLDELRHRPPVEIERLFDAINGFIQRLRANRTLTEGFIADVAHQTRTSLSALQGHLTLAADAQTEAELRHRLKRAERQGERTIRLTNQLLSHAMVVHRSDRDGLHPVALTPLLRALMAELIRDTRTRDVTFTFDVDDFAPGGDRVLGDEVALREAFRNLIENALRHGPADNVIDIDLRADGPDRIFVSVSDAGPGIPEPDRARALERFTSLSPATAGSGLGLAIVQAVAQAHHAGLRLTTSARGGLKVIMTFARIALLAALLWPTDPAMAAVVRVASATDEAAMTGLIAAFEARNPDIQIVYSDRQTVPLYQQALDGTLRADVIISSAMDLQVDLVNRGLARPLDLIEARGLPARAVWRDELFAFTLEPAVLIYDRRIIAESELPDTHEGLIAFIRNRDHLLRGRIGIYDIRAAGIGYLFATQDAELGQGVAQLEEALGHAEVRVFPTTRDMTARVAGGELTMALNLIGSYALAIDDPNVGIHLFRDYNLVMMRTAFVTTFAEDAAAAARFVAFLISHPGQTDIAEEGQLLPILPLLSLQTPSMRLIREHAGTILPIRLGPQLLTYLDAVKQRRFIANWESALRIPPLPHSNTLPIDRTRP
ncbi:sensor histidine kinase [Falsirhodobacter halotolerans]|uniref:sensor histidine kinase n=1 Tax=Falsirhodobacter halotolerans TaxID=1146892 RepID=UPI001FD54022|nr:extracellular solute-binding protein [Falsirhodobacter halotolerans]MCJ8140929.1 extracellular solute-binding protein [Falsirhodobacter halotolerans]